MFIEVATRPLQAMNCIQFIPSINKLLFILSFAAMYNFLKITNIKWHKKKYAFAQIILSWENIIFWIIEGKQESHIRFLEGKRNL